MTSRACLAVSVALFAPAFLGCGGDSESAEQTQPAEQATQTAEASPTTEPTASASPPEPTAQAENAGYPPEVERNFLNACEANGGSASQCSCALDEVKKEFTYDEYLKEEAAVAAGGTASRRITDSIAKCR